MTIAERYKIVTDYFEKVMPHPETELKYSDPFGLLVAVILSAQCTDKRVNIITPPLLKAFPDAASMAKATPGEIFKYISSCSYPNNKARYLCAMAGSLERNYNGLIPSDPDELVKLPGVGRKTANVIASVLFGKPVMAVDTHVFRVSARLGLTSNATNAAQAEKQLTAHFPEHLIPKAHHWLIFHGRYVCRAKSPLCSECGLTDICKWYGENHKQY